MSQAKYLTIIFFLVLSLFASVFLVLKTTVFYGKAATGNTAVVALENSYLFASPLQARADGEELVRVTAFVLDGQGMGIPNKTVNISQNGALKITAVQAVTDDAGKAIFDIASGIKNTYMISASVDGQALPQKVRVGFY